jgi:hypothetical protein
MMGFHMVLALLTTDQIIATIGLFVSIIQAIVLPFTLYLLVVQTRAMRQQTTALIEQSKEMTAQTRIFTDTIYSATYQSLYDAEAHIGDLMMTYPEASRILMSPTASSASSPVELAPPGTDRGDVHMEKDPVLNERVRWLGTSMLDFFEHIWTQAQKGSLPKDVWEAWEDYMNKIFSETHVRTLWPLERSYYAPGFRHFIDLKVGLASDISPLPPIPRPQHATPDREKSQPTASSQPQVARIIRAVTQEP